ncbi:MAG: hypothetical protein GX537_10745, partial [Actinobacteria bacterium]|nr:hypothetical protein [Actinomycetota bacterium]
MSSAETERPLGRIWRALAGRTVLPFAVGFAVVMVFVFWEVLPVWQVITSPDDAPFHARNAFAGEVERWLADRDVFMWQRLFRAPAPLAWHEFSYMACLFWLGLSGVFYLRTQRAHRVAAWGGGLFLALSGYMCTLFSAGHLGFFYLMASVFWSLGLIARALERRDLRLFALLGCAVMWGQAGQPDVWVLAMAVVAAYVLWRLLALWRGGLPARRLLLEVCPRFALTAVVAAALGVGGIRQVFQQHLAGRDRQIAEASGQRQAGGALTAQSAADRWHFSTGWSLPPE